jgi:3',5'-cyclic AMP phosphodiesterase CpdA
MDRRQFLSLTALTTASVAAGKLGLAGPKPVEGPADFDFIFITDTHIQPELNAAGGCARCFKKARSIPADFAIQGGDHVIDATAADRQRAHALFDLYAQTEQDLGLKVHHTLGNHDVFGISPKSAMAPSDAQYGKQMYEDRWGPTYYSFEHKGYHFIVLDSIQPTDDRSWEARIDARQLDWLKKDLAGVAAPAPVIVVVHVPLVTGALSYRPLPTSHENQFYVANTFEVLPLLADHNVLAVLQGHWHINEVVTFRGIPFVTSGAVCGNWWHGARWGTPEGFTVVSLRSGKINWRYETYGFKSVDPQNT